MSFVKFSSAQCAPANDNPRNKSKGAPTTGQPPTQRVGARDEAMAKYGITRIPVDYFHFDNFRYTNLRDAVAQAKRAAQR